MGLFSAYMGLDKKTSSLNEDVVLKEAEKGDDNFTLDEDDDEAVEDVEQGDTPEDAADTAAGEDDYGDDDFTLDEDDGATEETEEEAPTEEDNVEDTDDQEDDFTLGDDTGDDVPTEEGGEDNNTDAPAPDEGGNAEGGTEETGGEDDFTMDDNAGDEDGNAEGNEGGDQAQGQEGQDQGGQQQQNNGGGDKTSKNPTDNISDEDARAAEEQIYNGLTDDQKRIRLLQLKVDYKDLYETANTTLDGINYIPKNDDNVITIKRLTEFITKCKDILIDYIENNFDKNSYLENYTTYVKFLAIFRTITKVLDEMNKVKENN